jgi:hypothetical protein
MRARLAEALGTVLLRCASRLLCYAERQYGAQVTPPLPPEELPPRVAALIEDIQRGDSLEEWLA